MGWKRLLACCRKERAMWRAYYETATGKLISVGSVWPEVSPPGISFIESDVPIDMSTKMWDESSRSFVSRPAKVLIDRWNDLLTNPFYSDFQAVYNSLNASRKALIRNELVKWAGKARYRAPGNSIVIEE